MNYLELLFIHAAGLDVKNERELLFSHVARLECGCHLRFFSKLCMRVVDKKKLTMLAYCVAANCNNLQTTPDITNARAPAQSTCSEAKVD